MKMSEVQKTMGAITALKTSTGDTFSYESSCAALIRLSYLKAEIEKAEKAIKENIPTDKLPFANSDGEIKSVATRSYKQDVQEIQKALDPAIFWEHVKIEKTGLDKKSKAIVESNETIEKESFSIRVTKTRKIEELGDFTIE